MTQKLASYTFMPSVRRGLAAAIGSSANGHRASFKTEIGIQTDRKYPNIQTTIGKNLELYGPGDIIGFDSSMVVRTDPLDNVGDFEPNYFPMVEFVEADFPWRFTAAPFNEKGDLKPWIVLVVLVAEDVPNSKKKEILDEGRFEKTQVPYIEVYRKYLPDLENSHRWAHAQATTPRDPENSETNELSADNLMEILRSEPYRAVSRLLCPRRLRPGVKYMGLVVPAFDLGHYAARGELPEGANALKPAWSKNDETVPFKLPYYYRWEFRTGLRGDFEHLVRLLEPRARGLMDLGLRAMNCSNPGYGLTGITYTAETADGQDNYKNQLKLEGAIQSKGTNYSPWGLDASQGPDETDFMNSLCNILKGADENPPWVLPPVYGRWHYCYEEENHSWQEPSWINHLNLDPRHRAAAGLGAEVVRKHQEALMASAWRQLGDIETVNEILRRAQIGREAASIATKRMEELSIADYLRVTKPLHTKVKEPDQKCTVQHAVQESRIGTAFTDPAFRRMTRKRGVIRKRQKESITKEDVLMRMNSGSLKVAEALLNVTGMDGIDDVRVEHIAPQIITTPEKNEQTGLFKYEIRTGKAMKNIWDWEVKGPDWIKIKAKNRNRIVLAGMPPDQEIKSGRRISQKKSFTIQVACVRKDNALPSIVQEFEIVVDTRKAPSRRRSPASRIWRDRRPGIPAEAQEKTYWQVRSVKTTPTDSAVKETLKTWLKTEPPPKDPPLGISDLELYYDKIKAQLSPDATILKRVRSKMAFRTFPKDNQDQDEPGHTLDTIRAAPDFPQPMYEALAELSAAHVLPGLEDIAQNTVALLETNPRFIEAFMCGLNHEFARELLWREYPTDQRSSCFRQFWDVSDRPVFEDERKCAFKWYMTKENLKTPDKWPKEDKRQIFELYGGKVSDWKKMEQDAKDTAVKKIIEKKAIEEYLKDIKSLDQWNGEKLGENGNDMECREEVGQPLVLLVRGDLLKKYPNSVIYAVGTHEEAPDLQEYWNEIPQKRQIKYPIFSGRLLPDIAFMGFNLAESEARKNWYFVLEQRIGEPRFGLDVPEGKGFNGWDSLAWNHFGIDDDDSFDEYIEDYKLHGPSSDKLEEWRKNAAAVAAITLQKPVRIAIHASQLLPEEESSD